MTDDELAFLQKAHRASGAILRGEMPAAAEHAALCQLLTRLTPVVKRLAAEQVAGNDRSETPRGRFFGGRFH